MKFVLDIIVLDIFQEKIRRTQSRCNPFEGWLFEVKGNALDIEFYPIFNTRVYLVLFKLNNDKSNILLFIFPK